LVEQFIKEVDSCIRWYNERRIKISFGAWRGESFAMPACTAVAFLWLAIPASTGAMGLWFAALPTGSAVRTSGFLFLCPFFAALIAFALNGEMLSTHEMLGGMMIAVGIVLLSGPPAARP